MNIYIFPAIATKTNNSYSVHFPDITGCVAVGDSLNEAFLLAKESLAFHLQGMVEDNDSIPKATPVENIILNSNEYLCLIEAEVNIQKIA